MFGFKRASKPTANNQGSDYIPIACYYNEHTLLTKNGELLQTIEIKGLDNQPIVENLSLLRQSIRKAIKNVIKTSDFAIWMHVIKTKTNLDDPAPHNNLFSSILHEFWQKKNYWQDKYVNNLYITIVYRSAEIKISNLNAYINSLSFNLIKDFQNRYLSNSYQNLENTVSKIYEQLKVYQPIRLGVEFKNNQAISSLTFLYNRLCNINENHLFLPISDLSNYINESDYRINQFTLEAINKINGSKQFTSIIATREYHEQPEEVFNGFLDLPLEMVITEVFYITDKKSPLKFYEHQKYILDISDSKELENYKGLSKIYESANSKDEFICNQQIMISTSAPNLEQLEGQVSRISEELSKIGIAHFCEDINLEAMFWSQMPGNFTFLKRGSYIPLDYTCGFSLLHNHQFGRQFSPWGKAITLLRSEKGAPYFFNFHDLKGSGHTCIFGGNQSGKTILTNFLISETTKLNPQILYITTDERSKIFINAIGGQFSNETKNFINPFKIFSLFEQKNIFYKEFFKIILNHYYEHLENEELDFIDYIILEAQKNQLGIITFNEFIKSLDYSKPGGAKIEILLKNFNEELYLGIFDQNNINLDEQKIIALNLYQYTEEFFAKKFKPSNENQIGFYNDSLNFFSNILISIIDTLIIHFTSDYETPKILVIENWDKLFTSHNFSPYITKWSEMLHASNGIILANFNYNVSPNYFNIPIFKTFSSKLNTLITFPSIAKDDTIYKFLNLDSDEIFKIKKLLIASRKFLIKQNDHSVLAELSMGSHIELLKILSASELNLEEFSKFLGKKLTLPASDIEELIKKFK